MNIDIEQKEEIPGYPYLATYKIGPKILHSQSIYMINKVDGCLWCIPFDTSIIPFEISSDSEYFALPKGTKITLTQ